ncbi:MAG: hypothetical protein ACU841_02415 [Gammaproteobacteria bacterium]
MAHDRHAFQGRAETGGTILAALSLESSAYRQTTGIMNRLEIRPEQVYHALSGQDD